MTLDLYHGYMRPNEAILIVEALRVNSTLTLLNLSYFDVKLQGAGAISNALKVTSSLTTLNLDVNRLASTGAIAIAEALKVNPSLTSLSNFIDDNGGIAITDSLRRQQPNLFSLEILNLNLTELTNEAAMARLLKEQSSLTSL
jgi:Leucine Rich repeat